MKKLEQVNSSYKKALIPIFSRHFSPDEARLTDVLIDPSFQTGRVWVICTPKTLRKIKQKELIIQEEMSKRVKMRFIPKLTYEIDQGELERVEKLFQSLENHEG